MLKYPYPITVRGLEPEEGSGFFAEVPDLPGCMADGETESEALSNAHEAIREWIDAAKELGREIPEPNCLNRFSGKWVQRVPKHLHKKLAVEAKREGVSLNTLATTLLAGGLGKSA